MAKNRTLLMAFSPYTRQAPGRGFSLVELMIAVVVGLLGILAIMSVYLVSEGQKRTSTGGADAGENAAMALATIERDVRIAGLGLVGLPCTTVNGVSTTLGNFNFVPLPVVITRDSPAAGTDTVTVVYSTSPYGSVSTTLNTAMATSDAVLNPVNGDGFVAGDLILLSQTGQPACSLIQASANGVQGGSATWTVDHLPGGTTPFNPAVGTNSFPAGGYGVGARVTNMGPGPCCTVPTPANPMVRRVYSVAGPGNTSLMALNQNLAVGAGPPVNPAAVVEGVIAIRAQYGRDTSAPADGYLDVFDNTAPATPSELVAIRIAVVARSGQFENTAVSPTPLVLWPGGTTANGGAIDLSSSTTAVNSQNYRYRVYQTTIPLRNVIWTNN